MSTFTDTSATHAAMLYGLDNHLREALRKRFQEQADIVINGAVNDAMKTFEYTINQYRRFDKFESLVEVILSDKRRG